MLYVSVVCLISAIFFGLIALFTDAPWAELNFAISIASFIVCFIAGLIFRRI